MPQARHAHEDEDPGVAWADWPRIIVCPVNDPKRAQAIREAVETVLEANKRRAAVKVAAAVSGS